MTTTTQQAKQAAIILHVQRYYEEMSHDQRKAEADWLRMLARLHEVYDVKLYDISGRINLDFDELLDLIDEQDNLERDMVELDEPPGHPDYPDLKATQLDLGMQDIAAKAGELARG